MTKDQVFPTALLESKELHGMKNDAVVIYLVMRARQCADLTINHDRLPDEVGLTPFTVQRIMTDLLKAGWIKKDTYGSYILKDKDGWILDQRIGQKKTYQKAPEPPKRKPTVEFMTTIADIKHNQAEKFAKDLKPRKNQNTKHLLKYFNDLNEEVFNETEPIASNPKNLSMLKRALDNSQGDHATVRKVLRFMFDEWSKVCRVVGIKDPRPTLSHVGTVSFYTRIKNLCLHGESNQEISTKHRGTEHEENGQRGWGITLTNAG